MDIDVFPRHALPTVMRVLRSALAPSGPLSAPERLFLETYARIAGTAPPSIDPAPLPADDVAVDGPHQRKRLLQLAALAVLLARPVKPEALAYLKALGAQLQVHDPVIEVIDALRRGRHLRVRMLVLGRAMRAMLKEAWRAEGAMGVLRLQAAMWLGAAVNKPLRTRFQRLGLLPEGTLGRRYWQFMTECGFGFPGEPAGIAATLAYHDVAHVLAGHAATPEGEIQQGSFQGGNRRDDGFFFIQFAIVQFHHGVRITPATGPQTGHYAPDRVLWAIHRGARCSVDMTRQWDFWPLMALPLDEARRRCALMPALPAGGPGPRP